MDPDYKYESDKDRRLVEDLSAFYKIPNMDEIPTPETDAAYKQWLFESDKSHRIRMRSKMRDLERRLAACRELLASLDPYPDEEIEPARYGVYCEMTTTEIIAIRETLTQTAPKQ